MNSLKKILALLLCLSLALSLAACGADQNDANKKDSETEPNTTQLDPAELGDDERDDDSGFGMQIANPFIDCDDLEQAEKLAGFTITLPDAPEGYSEIFIQAVENDMIQVFYSNGTLGEAGTESVLLRKAAGVQDVSGDYNEYDVELLQDVNGYEVTFEGFQPLYHLATWTDGSYSYSVSVTDGTDLNTMIALVNGLK